ncbi:MAG: SUMF1/EgtB/PvdO family nonheme iron enzyme [Planctomycetota bacterium]
MARRAGSTVIDLGPELWLGAFGKHPGWNDHIDDLGLETDRLVAVKRALYTEGIGGVVDSGHWESLEGGRRTEGFDHSFLWRNHDGLVVGRLWNSSDGKGRDRYPMILACQCKGAPLRFVTERVLPRLRTLEEECRRAESAATVISLVDAARRELRIAAEKSGRVSREPMQPPAAVSVLAGVESMGPDLQGLERVLYQVERDFASYRRPERGESGTRSRTMDTRPQMMRTPRVSLNIGEEWGLWLRLLASRLDPLTPMLCITNEQRGWTDVIVGEPGSNQLRCLQASDEALPLTTSIPYTLDPTFKASVATQIEDGTRGRIAEFDPAYIDAAADRIAQMQRASSPAASRGGGGLPMPVIFAGIAGVVLLGAVLAAVAFFGGGIGGGPAADEDAPVEATSLSVAESRALDALDAWCAQADLWVLEVSAGLPRVESFGDGHVDRVIAFVSSGEAGGASRFDPVDALDVDFPATRPRAQFAASVRVGELPDVIGRAESRGTVSAGVADVERLSGLLSAQQWAAAGRVRALSDRLGAFGAEAAALSVGAIVQRLEAGTGRERLAAIEEIVSSQAAVERLHADLALLAEVVDGVANADLDGGDRVLAGFEALVREAVREAADGVTSLERVVVISERLSPTAAVGQDLGSFLDTGWLRVDAELFDQDPASIGAARDAADVRAWIAAASDLRFAQVDPSADPRLRGDLGPQVGAVAQRLGRIGNGWDGDDDTRAQINALRSRAESLAESWGRASAIPWTNATRDQVERETTEVAERLSILRDDADALGSELNVSIDQYVASLDPSLSRRGIKEIDTQWAALRADFVRRVGRDDAVALRLSVDTARSTLLSLEGRMPEVNLPARAQLLDVNDALAAQLSWTESTTRRAIDAMDWDGNAFASPDARAADAAVDELRRRTAELEELADDFVRIETNLLSGRAMNDRTGDGLTPEVALERWRDSAILEDDRVAAAASGVLELARAVESMGRVGMSQAIDALDHETFAVGMAAWRRVVDLSVDAPLTPAQFVQIEDSLHALKTQAARVGVDPVEDGLRSSITEAVTRSAQAATSADGLGGVVAVGGRLGVGVGDLGLSPGRAFDAALLGFIARARSVGVDDIAGVRAVIDDWSVVEAAGRRAGVPASSLDGIRPLLESAALEQDAGDRIDPATLGPGRAGFDGRWLSGTRLEYRAASGVVLRFAFVTPDGGDPVMLGEHEAPVSLLTDHVWSDPVARAAVEATLREASTNMDTLQGPRTWVWTSESGGAPVLADRWLRPAAATQSDFSGPGDGPTGRSPLTRVSRSAAVVLAAGVGCRLPTTAEWQAAYAGMGSPGPGPEFNLRDAALAARRDDLDRSSPQTEYPTEGAFRGRGEDDPQGYLAPTFEFNDGAVWFRPSRTGDPFADLLGNVAEMVAEYRGAAASARGDLGEGGGVSAADVEGFRRSGDLVVRVIGGSALSPIPPYAPLIEPREMSSRRAPMGFTDVGFRLAFGLGGRTVEQSAVSRAGARAAELPLLTIESGGS